MLFVYLLTFKKSELPIALLFLIVANTTKIDDNLALSHCWFSILELSKVLSFNVDKKPSRIVVRESTIVLHYYYNRKRLFFLSFSGSPCCITYHLFQKKTFQTPLSAHTYFLTLRRTNTCTNKRFADFFTIISNNFYSFIYSVSVGIL